MGRYLTLSILLAAIACSVFLMQMVPAEGAYYPPSDCCCNKTHNFFFGRRSQYDRLLFSNLTYVPAYGPRKTSQLLSLPPRPVYPAPIFTYIEVLDSYSDGFGGCARIVSGGVGNKYVVLNFTSSPNHPINSRTNIYGHY